MSTITEVPRSVRLPSDVDHRFDVLSETTGRSKSYYMREAMIAGLPNLEWAYGIAREAEGIRTGSIPTGPMQELLDEVGLTRAEIDAAPLLLDDDGFA